MIYFWETSNKIHTNLLSLSLTQIDYYVFNRLNTGTHLLAGIDREVEVLPECVTSER